MDKNDIDFRIELSVQEVIALGLKGGSVKKNHLLGKPGDSSLTPRTCVKVGRTSSTALFSHSLI